MNTRKALEHDLNEMKRSLQKLRTANQEQRNLGAMMDNLIGEKCKAGSDHTACLIVTEASELDSVVTEYMVLAAELMLVVEDGKDNETLQAAARDTVEHLKAATGGLRSYLHETFDGLIADLAKDLA